MSTTQTIEEAAAADAESQQVEVQEVAPEKSSALVGVVQDVPDGGNAVSAFASMSNFRTAQSMALALAASSLVPAAYRGRNNVGNCLVALELASRVHASPLMVMQNLHVIEGKPSWSSAFLIASVNASGRFTPLRFQIEGTPQKSGWKCRAIAKDKDSGEVLEGVWVTWDMANAEGWVQRRGSKWQTMPEQMIRYRAAAFWARLYAPEISLGMHTAEEMEDIGGVESAGSRDLTAAIKGSATVAEERPRDVAKAALSADCTRKCRVDEELNSVVHDPDCKHFSDEDPDA